MSSKRGLGRIISALLAAASVVGQAGAAPKAKKKGPASAPAVMKKVNKKRGVSLHDEGLNLKDLYKNPHNWAHLGLGIAAGGFGSLWLYDKLKGVKGGVEKFSEMLSLVHGDKAYSSLFSCVGSLLKNNGKKVTELFGESVLVLADGLAELKDADVAGLVSKDSKSVDDFKVAAKVNSPEACDTSKGVVTFKDNDDIFPSGDFGIKGDYGAFFLNASKIPAVKFEKGKGVQAIAELLLRKAFLDVCLAKGLVANDGLTSVNIVNSKALILGDEDFVSYLDSCALKKDKHNEGKVKEVWDKVKGFSDLLLEIIKSKSEDKKAE